MSKTSAPPPLTFVDLLLDNGELVRIECPSKYEDQLHDAITNSMKRRDWFACCQFDGCHAEYMGLSIDRVAMWRVVAML